MKFGLFGSAKSAPVDSDIDSAVGYNDWIKFNQEAEKLGYYSTFTAVSYTHLTLPTRS